LHAAKAVRRRQKWWRWGSGDRRANNAIKELSHPEFRELERMNNVPVFIPGLCNVGEERRRIFCIEAANMRKCF
jgi:hypothetical protein